MAKELKCPQKRIQSGIGGGADDTVEGIRKNVFGRLNQSRGTVFLFRLFDGPLGLSGALIDGIV
jgi:hypothetical protein